MPRELVLRDALNGEVYQSLDTYNQERNQRSLILTHFAGNNDIMKGSQTLQLTNTTLGGTIDVISVGSPISQNRLGQELNDSGINLVGQYNNWKDPVTNSKTWVVGTRALVAGGAIYGATIGAASTASGVGLESYFTGLIGGGIGGGIGILNLKIQHPYEQYHNNNFKGLTNDIKNWSVQNPTR